MPTELVASGLRLADATRGLTIAGNGSFHGKPIRITASGRYTVRLALGRGDGTIDLIARGGEMLKSAATLGGGDVLRGVKIALSDASSRRAARSAPTT